MVHMGPSFPNPRPRTSCPASVSFLPNQVQELPRRGAAERPSHHWPTGGTPLTPAGRSVQQDLIPGRVVLKPDKSGLSLLFSTTQKGSSCLWGGPPVSRCLGAPGLAPGSTANTLVRRTGRQVEVDGGRRGEGKTSGPPEGFSQVQEDNRLQSETLGNQDPHPVNNVQLRSPHANWPICLARVPGEVGLPARPAAALCLTSEPAEGSLSLGLWAAGSQG